MAAPSVSCIQMIADGETRKLRGMAQSLHRNVEIPCLICSNSHCKRTSTPSQLAACHAELGDHGNAAAALEAVAAKHPADSCILLQLATAYARSVGPCRGIKPARRCHDSRRRAHPHPSVEQTYCELNIHNLSATTATLAICVQAGRAGICADHSTAGC